MDSGFGSAQEVSPGDWVRDFLRPRYLSFAISLFLAMYVGLKFILLVFNAADVGERWSFELTPFALLNFPDLQLALLASVATATNAFLHHTPERKHRGWAILLTASMAAGLLLALHGASTDLEPENVGRLVSLALLLGMVALDHVDSLRVREETREEAREETMEDFITSELDAIAQQEEAAEDVTPSAVAEALRELEALIQDLPETEDLPAPARTPSSDSDTDDDLQQVIESVLAHSDSIRGPREAAGTPVPRRASPPVPGVEAAAEDAERIEDRIGSLRGRLARSAASLMEDARMLRDRGKLEKAIRKLDQVADLDARYPGLWELAADVYERLGERDVAAECRRRAREWTR